MNIAIIAVMVAFAVAVLLLLVFLVKSFLFTGFLVRNFRRCNVVVDGKKGKGKDLLFQHMINKRKEPYYSNIDYGGDGKIIPLKKVSVEPNTYKEFIAGNVKRISRWQRERADIYISDGGVYLPSDLDSLLVKTYPSMPIEYALSRHIADSNIHVNAQNINRIWKKLREQADFFVHVERCIKMPFHIFVHCYTYDNIDSAISCLRPLKARWFNKYSKAETDLYQSQHGEIKGGWLIIPKSSLKYDTRFFEKVLFGEQARIEAWDEGNSPTSPVIDKPNQEEHAQA